MATVEPDLYMIGHAHLDAVWLWPWTEAYQEARATLRAAVQLLNEDETYVFSVEQVVFLDWVRESDPELFAQIQHFVREERIQVVGGWWVEPDANLPSLESYVRQGLYGQNFLKRHFGTYATVAFNIDAFGHSAALPQIVRKQGISSYCFLRPGPHESPLPHTLFNWEGIDGTTIPSYRIPHEYCSPEEDLHEHMKEAVEAIVPTATGAAMVFYGVGNHGGGPTRENLHSIAEIQRDGQYGTLKLSGPAEYFAAVDSSGAELPVWQGELQRHAAGCFSTLSNFKKLHLQTENLLLESERYSAIATLHLGWDYPHAELEQAWKNLLFNQFHDTLPGTSIESAHRDADHQMGAAYAQAQVVANRAMQRIANRVAIPHDDSTQPLVVFNPHPRAVTTLAEAELAFAGSDWELLDDQGTLVPFQYVQPEATINQAVDSRGLSRRRIAFNATVPGLGYAVYRIRKTAQATPVAPHAWVRSDGLTLSNGNVDVTLNPQTGWISKFVNRHTGIELEVPANRPHTVVSADESDTWGHGVNSYVLPGESFEVQSISVEESGPLRAAIRVESRYRQSTLIEVFRLSHEADSLEVDVHLDWQEKLTLLKLRAPLGIQSQQARYQLQYGYLERPADSLEYPGQRWVSVAGENVDQPIQATVVTNAKYAYDCVDGDIGITAVRSPVYAWHDPKTLDSDTRYSYQDQGIQTFKYAIHVHNADDQGVRATELAEEMMMPLRVRLESFHDGELPPRHGFLDIGPESGLSLAGLKLAEGSQTELIVRVVNNRPEPVSGALSGDLVAPNPHSFSLDRFEIKTTKVTPGESCSVAVDLVEQEQADV